MMDSVRNFIRRVLEENNSVVSNTDSFANVYKGHDGAQFPYLNSMPNVIMPNQINPKREYVKNWQHLSDNNAVYEFPTDEFNLGLKIERGRNEEFNIMDVGQKVLEMLRDDPQFYSNAVKLEEPQYPTV